MPRRTAAHAAATREAVLQAASEAFAELGYAAATTADIARAAGVTHGALFHHFRDKRALFQGVVERLQRAFVAEVMRDGRAAAGGAASAFRAGITTALRLSQAPTYRRIVLIEAPSVLGEMDWRTIDSALGLAVIAPALEALARPATPSPTAVRLMGIFVLGALNEAAFAMARGESGVTIQGIVDEIMLTLDGWVRRQ